MEDPNFRKIPPDRHGERERSSELCGDSIADEPRINVIEEMVEHDTADMESDKVSTEQEHQPLKSYKDSLTKCKGLGFNGVAHGGPVYEDDPLMSDLVDQTWEMPEPSEEIKKLMQVYPVVPITLEEFNEDCKPWNTSLIVTVLGVRINLFKVKERLGRLWGFHDFDFIDLPNNYYIVRFHMEDQGWGLKYQRILFEGPWVIAQHSVLVQRWSPHFDPFHNPLGRIATWVRVPNIPIHCYTKNMWRLGNMIGKTLKVDMNTIENLEADVTRVQRGRFARICVEIDLQKKLVPRVICQAALFNIEYEGLGMICFGCGRYGHRKEICPWRVLPVNSGKTENEDEIIVTATPMPAWSPEARLPTNEERFGPWMLAQGGFKARGPKPVSRKRNFVAKEPPGRKGNSNFSQSTFEMLEEWDREECEAGVTGAGLDGQWSEAQKREAEASGATNRTKGMRETATSSQKGKGKINESQKGRDHRGESSKTSSKGTRPGIKLKAHTTPL